MPSEEAATVKKKKTGKPTKNCSCKMGITGVAKRGGQIQLKRCLDAPLIKLQAGENIDDRKLFQGLPAVWMNA